MRIQIPTYLPLVLTATAALCGCYDPELGDRPFRCAPTGKQCPDGYSCDKATKVCLPENTRLDNGSPDAGGPKDAKLPPSKDGPIYLDGHPHQEGIGCKDKASEPNNSAETATLIPRAGEHPGWNTCYPGDVDHFAVDLVAGDSLMVKISFSHVQGDLDAALLDPDGKVIAQSRSEDDNEEVSVRAAVKPGTYVFGVFGFGDATNSYDLDVQF